MRWFPKVLPISTVLNNNKKTVNQDSSLTFLIFVWNWLMTSEKSSNKIDEFVEEWTKDQCDCDTVAVVAGMIVAVLIMIK